MMREWNEETAFYATVTSVTHTDLGSIVVQDVRESDAGGVRYVQVVAVYGDEDELKRLIVFTNAGTEVLIGEGLIRS